MFKSDEFKEIGTGLDSFNTLNAQDTEAVYRDDIPNVSTFASQKQDIDAAPSQIPPPIYFPDVANHELLRKLDEMTTKNERLNDRCKNLAEMRDDLSKQVTELRKKVDEYEALNLNGSTEAIRLLGKLMDEEVALREEARKNGLLPPDHNPYDRHNQFVNLFFKLMSRGEK